MEKFNLNIEGEYLHLKDISRYNNNYFSIKATVEYSNLGDFVIYEQCDENYDCYSYFIGKVEDGKFIEFAKIAETYGKSIFLE